MLTHCSSATETKHTLGFDRVGEAAVLKVLLRLFEFMEKDENDSWKSIIDSQFMHYNKTTKKVIENMNPIKIHGIHGKA